MRIHRRRYRPVVNAAYICVAESITTGDLTEAVQLGIGIVPAFGVDAHWRISVALGETSAKRLWTVAYSAGTSAKPP